MSLFKSLKELDQKFSWSFFGFMLAIAAMIVTIYIEFFKENKPDLNYIITANTSVLDIREKLGSLDVLYHGNSLSKNKQDLRLITFEVINQGNTSILSNFYDSNDPVGFSVIDGKIADKPILIEASNNYLKEKLVIKKISDNSVVFSNVILEPDESFKIKILVLHGVSKTPKIKSFGKVAGVKNIDILMGFASGSKRSFLDETFGGGFYPNIVRLIVYSILFVLILIFLFLLVSAILKILNQMERKKEIQIFKAYEAAKILEKDNFFFDYYLSKGIPIIYQLFGLLNNQEQLNQHINGDINLQDDKLLSLRLKMNHDLFEELLSEEIIIVKNDIVIVNESRLTVLNDFVNFLKRKGKFIIYDKNKSSYQKKKKKKNKEKK